MTKKNTQLVNKEYLLQKYPGKGGWTYAEIPEISQNKNNPFGWVKVSGSIDGFALKQYKLMPMGNGRLFLPVKSEIRKKIHKEAGDIVRIILYPDDAPVEIPEEIIECFRHEPEDVFLYFSALPEGDRKAFIDWIYASKTDATKVSRIADMMKKLSIKKRFYD